MDDYISIPVLLVSKDWDPFRVVKCSLLASSTIKDLRAALAKLPGHIQLDHVRYLQDPFHASLNATTETLAAIAPLVKAAEPQAADVEDFLLLSTSRPDRATSPLEDPDYMTRPRDVRFIAVCDVTLAQPDLIMDVDEHGTGPIAHLDAIAAAIKHAELSPSAAAQPGELCRTQRLGHTCAIFNGLPPSLTGPPVAVFHAAFARFTEVWRGPLPELSSLDAGWTEAIARLLSCSKDHYPVKHKRTAAVKPCLKLLLPDGVVLEPSTIELDHGKSCQPDGNRAVASNIGSHLEAHNHFLRDLLFVVKNGDGQGGCDGEDQASHTYLNLCVQNTAAETRRRSVMPSLLLNLSQKHLEASGAVYLYTNPVCQRLAHISLVKDAATKDTDEVATVARFFLAVRECMALLKTHYEELTADSPLLPLSSFPFPHLTTVSDELTVRYDRWVFQERLGPRAVYFARRASDDRELVVKFAASYSVEAHQAAAQLGVAPPVLFADWHPKVQQFCIVMQRGDLGASHKDPELWRQLKRDLKELHRLGFVHGDIRLPNIVMDPPSGRLWILDWDWAGRVGEAKYPAALNPGDKRFPEGSVPCGDITVGDDDWMLDRAMGEAGIDLP